MHVADTARCELKREEVTTSSRSLACLLAVQPKGMQLWIRRDFVANATRGKTPAFYD